MATVREILISRLRPKIRDDLTWAALASLINGLSAPKKAEMLNAAKASNGCALGNRIVAAVNAKIEADSAAEADTMLADGSLSAADLERID